MARAWVDPAYKQRLLTDASAAIKEFGFSGLQGEDMVVVENTSDVHNVVVCTLCSCYPWPTLGLPPVWYNDRCHEGKCGPIKRRAAPGLVDPLERRLGGFYKPTENDP